MPDSLTVTFGGREVVLKRDANGSLYASDDGRLGVNVSAVYLRSYGWCHVADRRIYSDEADPQLAVSALEQKLVALRDSINTVLGDKP